MSNSLWLEEALVGEKDAPPLETEEHADVCIVGGGFTGLWTALFLKQHAPGLDVVLVEADVCGGGPSGRNGGFVMSMWSKILKLELLCGEDEALRVAHAAADAVVAIGAFCDENGIDAHYRYDGWLWAATGEAQLGAWDETVEAAERLGVEAFVRLAPDEAAARGGSPTHLAGVFEPTCATVQPALLARGLRRVALERGIRIFEHTPMPKLERSSPARVHTTLGAVTAGTVVLALNAWLAQLPELSRSLAVIASDMIATDPVPDRLAGDRPDERHRDLRFPTARQLLPDNAGRADRVRTRRRCAHPAGQDRPGVLGALAAARRRRRQLPRDLPGPGRRRDTEQLDRPDRPLARRAPVLRLAPRAVRPSLRVRVLRKWGRPVVPRWSHPHVARPRARRRMDAVAARAGPSWALPAGPDQGSGRSDRSRRGRAEGAGRGRRTPAWPGLRVRRGARAGGAGSYQEALTCSSSSRSSSGSCSSRSPGDGS